jgi:hypothetical protein
VGVVAYRTDAEGDPIGLAARVLTRPLAAPDVAPLIAEFAGPARSARPPPGLSLDDATVVVADAIAA